METRLVVFKDKQIRRTLHNNEWWFSVVDVCDSLTDSADDGAGIAGEAREKLEVETGEKVSTSENFLVEPEGRKRIGKT